MRILYVLEHYAPYVGGAEKLFQQLAESMAGKGHEVTVITTCFDPTLPERETLNGVRVRRLDCRNRFWFTFLALPPVWKAAQAADLIHATTYTAALPAWLAAKGKGMPSVLTFHEYWGKLWFKLPFLPWWERVAFWGYEQLVFRLPFGKIVAVSDFTKRELLRGGKSASVVHRIYNGLDYDLYSKRLRPPDKFTCTYFGRLGVSKGLDLLIPAMAMHLQAFPDTEFRLILPRTPAKMYGRVMKELERTGIRQQITLLHHLPKKELGEVVRGSSCVVIPSYSEGFCFAAAEAMAWGVPIISSGQGALKEVVSDPHLTLGELSAAALAEALAKAYRGEWETTPYQQFHLTEAVEGYIHLYEALGGEDY
jgi:glycosyltransferase involved in cell wall biosynthesis